MLETYVGNCSFAVEFSFHCTPSKSHNFHSPKAWKRLIHKRPCASHFRCASLSEASAVSVGRQMLQRSGKATCRRKHSSRSAADYLTWHILGPGSRRLKFSNGDAVRPKRQHRVQMSSEPGSHVLFMHRDAVQNLKIREQMRVS